MTAPPSVDDRELEATLAARSARTAQGDDAALLAAVRGSIAATGQVRLVPLVPVAWERVAWLAAVAVALVIGLTAGVVGPRWLQGIGATAIASATGAATDVAPVATPVPSIALDGVARVVPTPELTAALAAGGLHVGDTLLVDGTLGLDPTCSPATSDACPTRVFDDVPDVVLVDRSPRPQQPTGAPSIAAVRVTDDHDPAGRRLLELLTGEASLAPGGVPWHVDTVATMPASLDTTYVVRGWLDALPAFRCPANIGSPRPDRIEVCGNVTDFLTPDEFQAVMSASGGIQVIAPPIAIGVEPGDYQAFAPDPARDDRGAPTPREGTYLLRVERQGDLPRGRIVGRLGPLAVAAPSPADPAPEASPSPVASVPIATPAQLAAWIKRGATAGVVLVNGTMVADPRCPPPSQEGCRYRLLKGAPGVALLGDGYLKGQFEAPDRSVIALQLTSRKDEDGRPIVEVLADEVTLPEAGTPFDVAEILRLAPPAGVSTYLVDAWLMGDEVVACPARASRGYACGDGSLLVPAPTRSTNGESIRVQNAAYVQYADRPQGSGSAAVPLRGLYLVVRQAVAPCGVLEDCFVDDSNTQYLIQGRVDASPLSTAATDPSTASTITARLGQGAVSFASMVVRGVDGSTPEAVAVGEPLVVSPGANTIIISTDIAGPCWVTVDVRPRSQVTVVIDIARSSCSIEVQAASPGS